MSQHPVLQGMAAAHELGTLPVRLGTAALAAPFDALRWSHATAVRAGWLRRSLLESARFEKQLGALESSLLGPLARRV